MKKEPLIVFISILFLLVSCRVKDENIESAIFAPVNYVDPYIGTGGHGHTFLGVAAPFGAVQIGPNNINKGWDWCSGYHYSDSIVIGFSHLHLNGTGCSDTGDLLFMPYTGKMRTQPGTQDNPLSGYASYYSKSDETALPGYYGVVLKTHRTKVELTASDRVAFHRYTFPKNVEKYVMINLKDANGDDRPTDTFLEQVNDTTVSGYRCSSGWSKQQQIYFTAVFSEPIRLALFHDSIPVQGNVLQGIDVKGNVIVASDVENLDVKVGISPVSMENAAANIRQEIADWNFERVVDETTAKWNAELSKLQVSTTDTVAKRIFYTALYHAFIQPAMFNDCNKEYRGTDKNVYGDPGFTNYTVFSLWDTYRAAHPLYTLVQPERVPDFINSMLAIYEQQGRLPVWHLYGSDTNEMIGIQSVPVIADAILKNMKGFNYERAYQAMKASMMSDYKGLSYVTNLEYIPADKEKESVAKGLEYAIADWGVAQVARKLGKVDDYEYFSKRALAYQKYWDKDTRFFRGKNQDGSWLTPFNPVHSTHRNDAYCEGNGWQYTWLVPHDVEGLISLLGGDDAFVSKLDSLFSVNADLGDAASPDISGLIGQYAHGNEPGHHTVYLYSYAGLQWKTVEKVDYILSQMYHDSPDGLQGNEDCGQMSAWYLLSSLGFYSVCPGSNQFILTAPLFDKATVKLGNGKILTITANQPEKNKYITSVSLNGKEIKHCYITYYQLMQGGTLDFTLSATPDKSWGTAPEYAPYSYTEQPTVSIPYIANDLDLFEGEITAELKSTTPEAVIHYTLDGSEPDENAPVYSEPFVLKETTIIKAKGYKKGFVPSRTYSIQATKAVLRPALSIQPTKHGVAYTYYEGEFQWVADLQKAKVVETGTIPEPSILNAKLPDHFGYIFTGYIYAPEDGVYEFSTRSDDGSVLYIGKEKVVDNDASHAAIVLELDARKIAQRISHRTAIEPPQGLAIQPLAAYHHALGYSHTDHIHILQGMDTIAHDGTGHRGNGDEQAKQPRKHPFLVQTHFLLLCLKTGSTISFMIEPTRNISSCIDLSSKAAGASAMAGLLTRCL